MSGCGDLPGTANLAPASSTADAGSGLLLATSKVAWYTTQGSVVRSTDAGTNWQVVFPIPGASEPVGEIDQSYFLGANKAWVATSPPSPNSLTTVMLWHTVNGGRTWALLTTIRPPSWGAYQLFFLNSRLGWMLLDTATGSTGLPGKMTLLQTTDGGSRWAEVSRALPVGLGEPPCKGLGLYGHIAFRTAKDGWLADGCPTSGGTLYSTQNGGESWHRQLLPKLASVRGGGISLAVPRFFADGAGVLAATLADGQFAFAVTHDGGADWAWAGSVLSTGGRGGFEPVQIVSDGTWVVGASGRVFVTHDQGHRWTVMPSTVSLTGFVGLDMSGSVGLASPGAYSPWLLRTTDQGRSWMAASLPRSAISVKATLAPIQTLAFGSPEVGWLGTSTGVVGTQDGGQTWQTELRTPGEVSAIDALSGAAAWALGTSFLAGTVNGGARWDLLAEPAAGPLSSVDFVTSTLGFGLVFIRGEKSTAVLEETTDGGHQWHALAAPGNLASVCFNSAQAGFAVRVTRRAVPEVLHTDDGGKVWTADFALPLGSPVDLTCIGSQTAAIVVLGGPSMQGSGYTVFRTIDGGAAWTPILASGVGLPAPGNPAHVTLGDGEFTTLIAVPSRALMPVLSSCANCQGGAVSTIMLISGHGTTWSTLPTLPHAATGASAFSFVTPRIGWIVAESTPGESAVVLHTINGGQTWTEASTVPST